MIEKFEKYIGELPEELQEKARQCNTKEELNTLLAENDVELSDDALEAVSGGCSKTSDKFNTGDRMNTPCPKCHYGLIYYDMCAFEKGYPSIFRMYCDTPGCENKGNLMWTSATSTTPVEPY